MVAGYVEEVKYDDLGRVNRIIIHGSTGQIISEMRMEYESKEGKTSGRPSQIEYYERAGSGNLSSSPEKTLRYMYDGMGNILEVRDGTDKTLYSYGYSKANQLVREDNMVFGKSYVTVYDRYGNITAQKAEPYKLNHSPETVVGSYAYDTDGRLSGYNGQAMAYDALGNPTTYRNKAVVWEKGRQMKSFNGIAFGYDGSGRRIRKGNVTYTYDASGNLISSSDGLEYLYGMNGLLAVNDNGTIYFCRKDVQGNIIALLDANGKVVVQYVYDAWGNHAVLDSNGNDLTSSSHIGNRNPFRYRGYFYDVETGLYYLQTRYYDPEVGRFLNMDDVSYADPEQFHGLNLYAYCGNDPVNRIDPNGTFWGMILIGALIGGLFNGISALASGATLGQAALSFLSGGIMGAAMGATVALAGLATLGTIGFGVGLSASALVGAAGNTASYLIENAAYGRDITGSGVVEAAVRGLTYGVTSFGLGYFAGGGAYFHSIKPNSPQYMKAVASGLAGARSAWQPFGMMANGIANGIASIFKCLPTNPFVQKVAIQGANVFMISLPRMAMRRLLDWMFGED